MTDVIDLAQEVLKDANYDTFEADGDSYSCIAFENDLCFGFAFTYSTSTELIEKWKVDSGDALSRFKFQIRNANTKSWNAYLVFLSCDVASETQLIKLSQIEENLIGARKIARCVELSSAAIRGAFLPLIGIQNPPVLEPINMVEEIQQRVVGVPKSAVSAFLEDAPPSEVFRRMGLSDDS